MEDTPCCRCCCHMLCPVRLGVPPDDQGGPASISTQCHGATQSPAVYIFWADVRRVIRERHGAFLRYGLLLQKYTAQTIWVKHAFLPTHFSQSRAILRSV